MKKVKSLSKLIETIDNDLKWRKLELTAINLAIPGGKRSQHLLRCGICVLYAHWEGFVKLAVTSYLSYISTQGLKRGDVVVPIWTLAVRPKLIEAAKAKSFTAHKWVCEFLSEAQTEPLEIPVDSALKHVQNLDFSLFQEVMQIAGLDSSWLDPQQTFLDEKLVKCRHAIAHGDFRDVDAEDYQLVHDNVLCWLETVRTNVQNAAAEKAYLAK